MIDDEFKSNYADDNNVVSCFFSLSADVVLFNSSYNMESFLGNINSYMKLMPDYRPKFIQEKIKPKCSVVHFPLKIIHIPSMVHRVSGDVLHITWPHRW